MGDSGSWDPSSWLDDTGTTAQNARGAVTTDLLTGSTQGGAAAPAPDKWTGFFQNLVGSVAQYAVAKDAAKSGLTPTVASNGQPVYTSTAPVAARQNMTMLVVGVVAVAVVLSLTRSKG